MAEPIQTRADPGAEPAALLYLALFSTTQLHVNLPAGGEALVLTSVPVAGIPKGTLHWEASHRQFPLGAFPEEDKRDGSVRITGAETLVRLPFDAPLEVRHPNRPQTLEFNLQFATEGTVPYAFARAELVTADGRCWPFYEKGPVSRGCECGWRCFRFR